MNQAQLRDRSRRHLDGGVAYPFGLDPPRSPVEHSQHRDEIVVVRHGCAGEDDEKIVVVQPESLRK